MIRLRIALLAVLIAGCQASPDRLHRSLGQFGGAEGLHQISRALVERSADDPQIGHFFADVDLVNLADRLAEHMCVELDGPCTYTGQPMPEAHFALGIRESDFNRMVELLQDIMDERGIDESAQNTLLARLAESRGEVIRQ
ncbi:MAG: group 1 truncated hemoglobin [Xanthomonadales bacterium]|nr:group 1 truncated hemoglobin [Xanthomonadales bacterium]